jgi:hypothetical protein
MLSEAQAAVATYQEVLAAHDNKLTTARDALAAAKRAQALEPTQKAAKVVVDARGQLELLEDQRTLITEGLDAAQKALIEAQKEADAAELLALQTEATDFDSQMSKLAANAAAALLATRRIKAEHEKVLAKMLANANRRRQLGETIDPLSSQYDLKRFSYAVSRELTGPVLDSRAAALTCLFLYQQGI